jgi:hypothetical protein
MDTKKEILQSLETYAAKHIEKSKFLELACEIAKNIREEEMLEALLMELKESAFHLARSERLRELYHSSKDSALMFDASRANYCACVRAYRAALIAAYSLRDFCLVYKLARMMGWHYPEDILEAVANRQETSNET